MVKLPINQVLKQAVDAHKAGQLQEAHRLYTAILKIQPKHPDANHNMGLLTVGFGKIELSLPFFKTALEANPGNAQFWYSHIVALIKLDRLIDAKFLLDQAKLKGFKVADFGQLEQKLNDAFKAQSIKPDYLKVYYNMGVALQEQNKLKEAIEAYKKALTIKPDFPDAYYNMGIAFKEQNKLDEAVEAYKKAISIKPDYANAFNNMGNALKEQNKLDEAVVAYKKAISIKPDYANAFNNMGIALQEQNKVEDAIEAYNKALAIKPDYADAYYNIGNALQEQNKVEDAIEVYNKAIAIKPDYADAYYNIGNVLQEQSKLEEAIMAYNKALSIKPDYAEAYNNMGNTLKAQGKLEEALVSLKKALLLKPDYADAYSNMGIALADQGRLEDAIEAYNKALAIKPDYAKAHMNLSFSLLNSNRLSEGLMEFEWRWKTKNGLKSLRHFSKPMWDGSLNLNNKTILLWSEQGPGDLVIWLSALKYFIPLVKKCIIECPKKLVPLLKRSFPVVQVCIEGTSEHLGIDEFDVHLPLGSLFKHFIPEIESRSIVDAFLLPDLERVDYWKERLISLGQGPFIGISWKSPVMTAIRSPNYAKLSDWKNLFLTPGVTFVNLQSTHFKEDLIKIETDLGVKVHNFDELDHYDDLDDVAALSAALDVCISIATAVSTISAAVGTMTIIPTWKQSPWNNVLFSSTGPKVEFHFRNSWEDWDNVFESITEKITTY